MSVSSCQTPWTSEEVGAVGDLILLLGAVNRDDVDSVVNETLRTADERFPLLITDIVLYLCFVCCVAP